MCLHLYSRFYVVCSRPCVLSPSRRSSSVLPDATPGIRTTALTTVASLGERSIDLNGSAGIDRTIHQRLEGHDIDMITMDYAAVTAESIKKSFLHHFQVEGNQREQHRHLKGRYMLQALTKSDKLHEHIAFIIHAGATKGASLHVHYSLCHIKGISVW